MAPTLERWRDPIFNNPYEHVPEPLAQRLTEMADELIADEQVARARDDHRIPRATGNVPVFPQRTGGLPDSLTVYNERLRALLAVAALTRTTDLASYEPPPDTKSHVGYVLGQAIHQGCTLADIALAAGLPPERVAEIAKRTIPATTRPVQASGSSAENRGRAV